MCAGPTAERPRLHVARFERFENVLPGNAGQRALRLFARAAGTSLCAINARRRFVSMMSIDLSLQSPPCKAFTGPQSLPLDFENYHQ